MAEHTRTLTVQSYSLGGGVGLGGLMGWRSVFESGKESVPEQVGSER